MARTVLATRLAVRAASASRISYRATSTIVGQVEDEGSAVVNPGVTKKLLWSRSVPSAVDFVLVLKGLNLSVQGAAKQAAQGPGHACKKQPSWRWKTVQCGAEGRDEESKQVKGSVHSLPLAGFVMVRHRFKYCERSSRFKCCLRPTGPFVATLSWCGWPTPSHLDRQPLQVHCQAALHGARLQTQHALERVAVLLLLPLKVPHVPLVVVGQRPQVRHQLGGGVKV